MFTVPIVPPDLRHEETIIQAALALDTLQQTINCVFGNIDARIARNNVKVQELANRIGKAQSKVKSLVGSKKAIKVYAPARFPATSNVFHDIPLTFTARSMPYKLVTTQDDGGDDDADATKKYEVHSRMESLLPQTLSEKLVFFHVRTAQQNSGANRLAESRAKLSQYNGMGAVPAEARSITSLLLYNTDERVYGAAGAESDINTWKRAKLFKNQRAARNRAAAGAAGSGGNTLKLDPAPHSLAHRTQQQPLAGGLRYTPRLHEAPAIDVPLDLPDLPGIADDIHFEGKAQQQIAPSLFIDNLPELPELEETQTHAIASEQQQADGAHDTALTSAAATHIPISKATTNINAATAGVTVAPLVQAPPPPPPPAAKMPLPPPPPPPPQPPTNAAAETGNVRSELMDAIRKAGGASGGRLRAAAPFSETAATDATAVKSANKPSNATKSGGGDLMADLHNKLLMRRKGISGAKQSEQSVAGSAPQLGSGSARNSSNPVIARLSALIPPPRKHSDDETGDEDDNDADWS